METLYRRTKVVDAKNHARSGFTDQETYRNMAIRVVSEMPFSVLEKAFHFKAVHRSEVGRKLLVFDVSVIEPCLNPNHYTKTE